MGAECNRWLMGSFLRNCTRPLHRRSSYCPLLRYVWKGVASKIRRYVHVRGGPRRSGSASWRASAPPRWQWQGVRMSRCQDVKGSAIGLVKMSRCQDVKMSRCQDAKMSRCQDVKGSVAGFVKMSRCQDVVKMSRCQDVKMSRCHTRRFG